ncbi:SMP-30/gluconolactonase/LRE family protein [Jannaschia sp. 2305UL9-9]|uniref:SMP-30/gluconolactonase/LRE family protein n=1 Tax=Jannaschia sp. 2305UL9-9 TaxID=3121638 RepID=UPI0035279E94
MIAQIHDTRACALGEGALWHPTRKQLFWFDITGRQLHSRQGAEQMSWAWDEAVSAAGWVDDDTLLVAGETGFWKFDIPTGTRIRICPLEADTPGTRSNDGRADPVGGFWIGTMGWQAEPGAGAIYRYFRGEVRKLFQDITIPNAICFSPDGMWAYFADTPTGIIWKQHIDRAGWPSGKPEVLIDYSGVGINPDGAVCDAEGNLWIAQWGVWRVACHAPDGQFLGAVTCGASQVTCPAFGGDDLRQMFITSAIGDLGPDALRHQPGAGQTWIADAGIAGQAERKVVL